MTMGNTPLRGYYARKVQEEGNANTLRQFRRVYLRGLALGAMIGVAVTALVLGTVS